MFGPSGKKRIQVLFRLKLLRSMHRIKHEASTSSGLQKAGILPILNDGSLLPGAVPLAPGSFVLRPLAWTKLSGLLCTARGERSVRRTDLDAFGQDRA